MNRAAFCCEDRYQHHVDVGVRIELAPDTTTFFIRDYTVEPALVVAAIFRCPWCGIELDASADPTAPPPPVFNVTITYYPGEPLDLKPVHTLADVEATARFVAQHRPDSVAVVRAFRELPTGQQFETAYKVDHGKVYEVDDHGNFIPAL